MEEEPLGVEALARRPRLALRAVHALQRRQRLLLERPLRRSGGVDQRHHHAEEGQQTEGHAHLLLGRDGERLGGQPVLRRQSRRPLVAHEVHEDDGEGEDIGGGQQRRHHVHERLDSSHQPGWRPAVGRVHPSGQVDEGERQQEDPEGLGSRPRGEVAPVVALDRAVTPAGEDRRAPHPLTHDDDVVRRVVAQHAGPVSPSDAVDPQLLGLRGLVRHPSLRSHRQPPAQPLADDSPTLLSRGAPPPAGP